MNSSSVPESQSGAIDFKDFTRRRMLHVILPLFIVSIIAFFRPREYRLCRFDHEGEFTMVNTRSIWYGRRNFLLLAMFYLKSLHHY